MRRAFLVVLVVALIGAMFSLPSSAAAVTIPTISIISVEPDTSVTIETADYPANVDFDVRMGKIGTHGVDGFLVDTVNSGSGGKQTFTFDIPADLLGMAQIAIRLESASGYFSYNWFTNVASAAVTPAPTATPEPGATPAPGSSFKIPTFSITGVVQDETVSIKTADFPADIIFDVRMGKIGTRGVDGVLVATINSGAGDSFEAEYEIPESLAGLEQISIRLESSSGYFSYNWFWNNTYP